MLFDVNKYDGDLLAEEFLRWALLRDVDLDDDQEWELLWDAWCCGAVAVVGGFVRLMADRAAGMGEGDGRKIGG